MKKIGAFEAKTHFSALLLDAERGETIIVTKNGKPVAQLGPIKPANRLQAPEDAMKALLSMKVTLGKTSTRELVEEGRRR
jgi:prevent-host-death family protein